MSNETDTKVFKLVKFSPIGFKAMNYPVQYCSICRGYLIEVCSICMEKGDDTCNIINSDGAYYHNHCFLLTKDKESRKKKL